MQLWLTIILDPPISPRWERFAPGPVREVVVHPDKKILASAKAASKKRAAKDQTSEPKKRGRPPKKIVAKEGDDNPFNGDQSEAAPLAVPPADAAMLEIVPTEEPQPLPPAEPAQEEPHGEQKAQPPPPNRSTFAGRTRVGSETFQSQWDSRRAMYYKVVPINFWKDPLEREYWSLCSQMDSLDDAMAKFLETKKIDAVVMPTAAPSPPAAPARRAARQPRQPKAKAKAAVKSTSRAARAGRGRGRGRGKGCNAK